MNWKKKKSGGIKIICQSEMRDFSAMAFITDHVNSLIDQWFPGESPRAGLPQGGKNAAQERRDCGMGPALSSTDGEPSGGAGSQAVALGYTVCGGSGKEWHQTYTW